MAKRSKKSTNMNVAEVEVRQGKIILKLGLNQFRAHHGKIFKMLKLKQMDGLELTFRGKVVAHLNPPGQPLPLPPPSPASLPPPPPEKLKAGKITL